MANSLLIKPMMSGKVKTDDQDAVHLARLLAVGMVPEVWVPPEEVRELRTLVAHRIRCGDCQEAVGGSMARSDRSGSRS